MCQQLILLQKTIAHEPIYTRSRGCTTVFTFPEYNPESTAETGRYPFNESCPSTTVEFANMPLPLPDYYAKANDIASSAAWNLMLIL